MHLETHDKEHLETYDKERLETYDKERLETYDKERLETYGKERLETYDKEGLKRILRRSVPAVKLLPECRRLVDVSIQEKVEGDEDVLSTRHAELGGRQQEVTTVRDGHGQQHDLGWDRSTMCRN